MASTDQLASRLRGPAGEAAAAAVAGCSSVGSSNRASTLMKANLIGRGGIPGGDVVEDEALVERSVAPKVVSD